MSGAGIVTIDGPSGSGKGTISRAVARQVHWHLLDSGALYRLVALAGLENGLRPDDISGHTQLAASMETVSYTHLDVYKRQEENCAIMVVETVKDFLENGNLRNCVNFPEAVLPRAPQTTRLAIANSNVPNMVGQISTCLAAAGLNIAELLNKSRGEYAYTLIDADGVVSEDLIGRLARIEGVLAARIV